MVEFCHRCRGIGGFPSEHLSNDFAAEQDLACDPDEPVQKCLEIFFVKAKKRDEWQVFEAWGPRELH